ncbi:amyloid-beta A4 precursor protein-binding family B member 3 isoform X1 [Alosa alosa]|uniref:amyloid-beta A4 precursor protein-binding family B member 3 isoform X1 n=1 Tax=Alosa sapidissima TaxID=34773 RepID=UPI001C08369A|nr:amyloid-beta A4 precursor protein-binding family B member 3 isoform X1 [Alosa sapidissima]XP_048084635.1 amyloid-beta A4 precursor protein-binding family B member 3 isoform X1 [Alosa alosa]
MLGKDYMLAIIIVNYDDNIWADQNLELDSNLPPGWRTIRDSTGTYYWHVPTGTTQWQHPSYSAEDEQNTINGITASNLKSIGAVEQNESSSRQNPGGPSNDRESWQEEYFYANMDPDSKCFAVRSLGWVEIPEEELTPGKSSLAVNNCIQQLSHSKVEGRDAVGAWGEGQDMMMVLKKDTLSLMDPVDHSLIHCQPIINIRVWGVGCNNGRDRDFAFVANDKDTCMLKCHVFRCNAPAKTIATALHEMCSKIMSEKAAMHPSMARSLTMESISPEDLPRQVDFLDAVRQRVQKFEVEYIGNLPVSRAMGMEVLNRAIESILHSRDRDEWEPIVIHVSDTMMSLWKGEDGDEPFWESQVRYLTFLGVGHDMHTFAIIVDAGTQRFECHVFWCEPDAGYISEAVQAACMVQYQKCLVAQTPPPRSKMWRAGSKVKRANSMDGSTFPPRCQGHSPPKMASSGVKKGMLAFFETFRNKQPVMPTP